MIQQIFLVSPPNYIHSAALMPFAESLCDSLDAYITSKPDKNLKTIVLGAHLLGDAWLPDDWIIYNTEQIGNGFGGNKDYLNLLARHEVWDYSQSNIDALGFGKLCTVGYMPCLEILEKREEDIPILFYGSLNERRQKIIWELRDNIIVAPCGTYGAELDVLISRSKIVLNMHFYETAIFEIFRCSYLFANKKCVVSEFGNDDGGYRDTGGFCSYDRLVEYCLAFLRNEELRNQVAQRGYDIFRRTSMADNVRAVL